MTRDYIVCRSCRKRVDINGLIGPTTDNCPYCGGQALPRKMLRVDFDKLCFSRCWIGRDLTDWVVECPNKHVLTCWGELRPGWLGHDYRTTRVLRGLSHRATLWGIVERDRKTKAIAIWFRDKPRIRAILRNADIKFVPKMSAVQREDD